MKLFSCQCCGQVLYFENNRCERCGHPLGYIPEVNTLSALEPAGDAWHPLHAPQLTYRFCANAKYDVCNWLVPAGTEAVYCAACRHNGTVPDPSDPLKLLAWRKMEVAKHRLIYTLMQLSLPLKTRREDPVHGLIFEFLADPPAQNGPPVLTGHDNGRITVALAEADDAEREKRRSEMGEPYRTLLGHFRHEVGHHYWDLLIRDGGRIDAARAVFGDERENYAAALKRHYAQGAPANWQESFVSSYATTHPWEDFAETWAHYLHIVDTLEMARSFGLRVSPQIDKTGMLEAEVDFDPYRVDGVQALIDAWLPMTFALNSLNRTMGQPDLYPFVLSPAAISKLGFVRELVSAGRS